MFSTFLTILWPLWNSSIFGTGVAPLADTLSYQDKNFKICLSLFGWKVNVMYKEHTVHWTYLISFSWKRLHLGLACASPTFHATYYLLKNWSDWTLCCIPNLRKVLTSEGIPVMKKLSIFTKFYIYIYLTYVTYIWHKNDNSLQNGDWGKHLTKIF